MTKAAELFVWSEPSDRTLRDELCSHLGPLVEAGLVREFPSETTSQETRDTLPHARLSSADVVVVLVSPEALAEGSSIQTVLKEALELERQRRTVLIPIRARSCEFDGGVLAERVVYPRDATALDSDSMRDYAFREAIAGILTGITLCHVTVGDLLLESERETAACASFRHARSIAEKLSAEFPDDLDHLALVALVRDRVGEALLAMGDGPGALTAFESAKEMHERLVPRVVDRLARRRLLGRCIESIGDVLRAMGEKSLALKAFQECLVLRQELVAETNDVALKREVAATHVRLGHVQRALGENAGALAAFREGMALADALAQEHAAGSTALVTEADAAAFEAERALFCFRAASVLADGGQAERDEARELLLRALGVYHDLEQRNVLPEPHKIWPPAVEAMLDSLDTSP
jgi:tetratricopeptide (TPR) repeat protein